jgi:hypothetical protein
VADAMIEAEFFNKVFFNRSRAALARRRYVPGSVLKMEMTVKNRDFTALKTEACGFTQAAYLHF